MEFKLLQEAHFDACTASHEGEYKRWLDVDDVQYVQRDKGNGLLWWYSVMGEHSTIDAVVNSDEFSVSRIDVAFDVLLSKEDIEKLYQFEGKLFPVKYMRYNNYRSSLTGRTVYFGSGDKLLRIYEKGRQLKLSEYYNWIRFEFELKGKIARETLAVSRNPKEIFEMLQRKYLYNALSSNTECTGILDFKQPKKDDYSFFVNTVRPYLLNKFDDEKTLMRALEPVFRQLKYKKSFKETLKSNT